VALGDVNGDGWCDIYLCRLEGPNALYLNRGQWHFEEVAAHAGVACPEQYSTGCALADVDGDGDLDLLVNGLGVGTRLFLNHGAGQFTESVDSGLQRKFGSTSLALADVDGDGDLDLYVANYRTTTVRSTGLKVLNVNGRKVVRPEDREQYEFTADGILLEHGEVDVLYLNDGKGRFTPVPWTGGAFCDETGQRLQNPPKDWGLSAMFHDINGDGLPDLYVCNDFGSADRIWWNESRDGAVRFRAAPWSALRHSSTFSMGVDFADIDRDGHDDFIVLDMMSRDHPRRMRQRSMFGQADAVPDQIQSRPQIERNTLFLGRGDGSFTDIAEYAGVQASEWSWGVAFVDVDLDGYEDLLITTGHAFDTQDADTEARLAALGPAPEGQVGARVLEFPPLRVAKVAFRNRGNLTFEECAVQWGFAQPGVTHGIALADLDNDGDLDVVVNNLNAPAGCYRNEIGAPRLLVRLQGQVPNTRAIGARLVLRGGPVGQSQEMRAGGRYLSSDEAACMFAAGNSSTRLALEVTWRSGARSELTNLQPNHAYVIAEPATRAPQPATRATASASAAPFFTEVTGLAQVHVDPVFDDFARQPLLPRRLSELGPGVAWLDLDGDGWEDLLLGTGKGGALGAWRNRGDGGFDAMRVGGVLGAAPDDQTALLGWAVEPGTTILCVAQANYETAETNLPSVHCFDLRRGRMQPAPALPSLGASPGPLAAADIDGDGNLDLFVGGRVRAGRYPEPVGSRLYRHDGERFVEAKAWPELGLIAGACFSDLTGDGLPELVVALEWGPVLVFRNVAGRFEPWDIPIRAANQSTAWPGQASTLQGLDGWWNGIASGDFDEDGRLDLVVSNWGENVPCRAFLAEGWRLYYGDVAGRGAVETLEAFSDPDYRRIVPWRDLEDVGQVMPWLREKFPSNTAYSQATIEQLLGERQAKTRERRVHWLASTLLLNRGDHFIVRSLPPEAQWTPAFAVCVGDYDGDGHDDVFLSQNFFGVNAHEARFDGGRGLWLKGDGRGNLSARPAPETGVLVYGQQRGAALADYDGDGRVDLVVSQNRASMRLYHNERGAPGVRVRLSGPKGNANGLGSVLRWGNGPARELQAGCGYWSQNSAVAVLARPTPDAKLSVRWPGGKVTTTEIPPAAKEVTVEFNGALRVMR